MRGDTETRDQLAVRLAREVSGELELVPPLGRDDVRALSSDYFREWALQRCRELYGRQRTNTISARVWLGRLEGK